MLKSRTFEFIASSDNEVMQSILSFSANNNNNTNSKTYNNNTNNQSVNLLHFKKSGKSRTHPE
eukprot:TCALIF_10170-PA protein Name:"Protein of unknown function" AED:0.12 eAED:0.12 QI:0/0/0.5/0.5/1/1/2/1436/62